MPYFQPTSLSVEYQCMNQSIVLPCPSVLSSLIDIHLILSSTSATPSSLYDSVSLYIQSESPRLPWNPSSDSIQVAKFTPSDLIAGKTISLNPTAYHQLDTLVLMLVATPSSNTINVWNDPFQSIIMTGPSFQRASSTPKDPIILSNNSQQDSSPFYDKDWNMDIKTGFIGWKLSLLFLCIALFLILSSMAFCVRKYLIKRAAVHNAIELKPRKEVTPSGTLASKRGALLHSTPTTAERALHQPSTSMKERTTTALAHTPTAHTPTAQTTTALTHALTHTPTATALNSSPMRNTVYPIEKTSTLYNTPPSLHCIIPMNTTDASLVPFHKAYTMPSRLSTLSDEGGLVPLSPSDTFHTM